MTSKPYQRYKGGRWTEIAVTKNNATLTFTVKGLAKGTVYTFRIKSVKTVDGADKSSEYASVKVNTAE